MHNKGYFSTSQQEQVTIHMTDDDDLPNLWMDEIPITTVPSDILTQQCNLVQDANVEKSHNTTMISKGGQVRGPTLPEAD